MLNIHNSLTPSTWAPASEDSGWQLLQVTGSRGPLKQREGAKPVPAGETEALSSAPRLAAGRQGSPSPTCIHGTQTHHRCCGAALTSSLHRDPRAWQRSAPPSAPCILAKASSLARVNRGKKKGISGKCSLKKAGCA